MTLKIVGRKNKIGFTHLIFIFQVSVTLRELGLDHPEGYHITDLYDDYDYQIVTPERRFKVDVNPSGSKYKRGSFSFDQYSYKARTGPRSAARFKPEV